MMGNKKPNEIRSELRRRLAESGLGLAWFDEQIRKLQQGPSTNEREIETLQILKRVLTETSRKKKRPSKGETKSRSAS